VRKVIFSYRLWKCSKQRKHSLRHRPSAVTSARSTRYGSINIRSVNDKFDDVMDMFRSHLLTVLCLTETWHDADSLVFDRCRASGFSVVNRPRPRVHDDLSVNHGGVTILAAQGTSLLRLSINSSPSTFEVVTCHVTTGRHRAAVAVVYRPGSQPITAQFFEDLTSSSHMRVIYHNWSATKQRPHPQSVAEISHHSVLLGDRIRQCETSSGSRHKDTDQCL